jgi:mannan endo-1,4-beta-mannosidase
MTLESRCTSSPSVKVWGILALVVIALTSVVANASTPAVYRINAGGSSYTDSAGNVWSGDKNYNMGSTVYINHAVGYTPDQKLFQTDRYNSATNANLTYSLPLANGTYRVQLYFAELYAPLMKTGARVFNVTMENSVIFRSLDVYGSVGANRALIKSATVTVTDGVLNIGFQRITQNPMVSAIEVISASSSGKALLAAYWGNQGFDMQQVRDLESWQGKKNAVINMFMSWCGSQNTDLFTRQLPNVWGNGNVPMITWEPYYCTSSSTPSDVETRAANGQYDSYLNSFADGLKKWLAGKDGVYGTSDDRRIYFRLAHEMNGNWYQWSGNPGDYIRMWRKVKSIFESKGMGISHVQFMWVVNVGDVGSYKAEQYYPGDGYVDWVGIDGYNAYSAGNWLEPPNRFDTMLSRMQKLTRKPIVIAEVGVMSATKSGVSTGTKSQWISDFFSYVAARPAIKMVCYFNKDKASDKDYAIVGGMRGTATYSISGRTYNVYTTYRNSVRNSYMIPSTTSNSRLMSDGQFAGQL